MCIREAAVHGLLLCGGKLCVCLAWLLGAEGRSHVHLAVWVQPPNPHLPLTGWGSQPWVVTSLSPHLLNHKNIATGVAHLRIQNTWRHSSTCVDGRPVEYEWQLSCDSSFIIHGLDTMTTFWCVIFKGPHIISQSSYIAKAIKSSKLNQFWHFKHMRAIKWSTVAKDIVCKSSGYFWSNT